MGFFFFFWEEPSVLLGGNYYYYYFILILVKSEGFSSGFLGLLLPFLGFFFPKKFLIKLGFKPDPVLRLRPIQKSKNPPTLVSKRPTYFIYFIKKSIAIGRGHLIRCIISFLYCLLARHFKKWTARLKKLGHFIFLGEMPHFLKNPFPRVSKEEAGTFIPSGYIKREAVILYPPGTNQATHLYPPGIIEKRGGGGGWGDQKIHPTISPQIDSTCET